MKVEEERAKLRGRIAAAEALKFDVERVMREGKQHPDTEGEEAFNILMRELSPFAVNHLLNPAAREALLERAARVLQVAHRNMLIILHVDAIQEAVKTTSTQAVRPIEIDLEEDGTPFKDGVYLAYSRRPDLLDQAKNGAKEDAVRQTLQLLQRDDLPLLPRLPKSFAEKRFLLRPTKDGGCFAQALTKIDGIVARYTYPENQETPRLSLVVSHPSLS